MTEVIGKSSNGIISVSLNGMEMASYDLEGRLVYYAIGSSVYRRSIYNEMYRLEWIANQERIVERVDHPEELFRRSYELARKAREITHEASLKKALVIPALRSPLWLSKDTQKVESLYSKISIVPPDLYFSTYLQLTTGCSWNLCTFCGLYKDRSYSVKSAREFSNHIHDVKDYLGKGVSARRNIFLGDANALDVNQKLLKQVFSLITKEFANPSVYSFVDAFTTPKNLTSTDFSELHSLGLKRVYLGLESGSPEVLKILNKPMNLRDARQFVKNLKTAGVNIGLIILIGAGGIKFWDEHVTSTCQMVEEMNPSRGDILYLSPLEETQSYANVTTKLNLGVLSQKQKEKQIREILQTLKSGKPTYSIARYNIRESFVS